MLPASVVDILLSSPVQPGFFLSRVFPPPEGNEYYIQIILRTLHFIAGIIWIGHLYFFNLVNVNLMKSLDGPTKGKVIPQLMPRALWWFRWGALITVLVGLMYYAMYILKADANDANKKGWVVFLVWFLIPVVIFAIEMVILKNVNNGWTLAVIVAILAMVLAFSVICWLKAQLAGYGRSEERRVGKEC